MNSRSGSVNTLFPDPSDNEDDVRISCSTSDAEMNEVSKESKEINMGISGVKSLVEDKESVDLEEYDEWTNLAGKPHAIHFSKQVKAKRISCGA